MRLFHFSDDAGIDRFEPRPVRTPADRRPGMAWLNGPLVWAIAEDHQQLYLFPRECPRIVMWAHDGTTENDRRAWLADVPAGVTAIAYIEKHWQERFERAALMRYELPCEHFADIGDAGMWVSRTAVVPLDTTRVLDLRAELAACHTELRAVDSLLPLKPVWQSSMHASGIRLRNAVDWA
ncbi:DUF6886 family protein [Variovorax sp. ZT5P49]|uniref:DUF6886 family protein n=1 Tax=Variovorax sp. ZT5P49 TaxID=3443733 RepID=UPI003F465F9E